MASSRLLSSAFTPANPPPGGDSSSSSQPSSPPSPSLKAPYPAKQPSNHASTALRRPPTPYRLPSVPGALCKAGLFCSPKKSDLFTTSIEFLGHVISRDGIMVDPSKTDKIKNWSCPQMVTQAHGFLGVMQYLQRLILWLAEQMAVLAPLTKKGLTDISSLWGGRRRSALLTRSNRWSLFSRC